MQYQKIIANDGCELAFQTSIDLHSHKATSSTQSITILLLIHGFSGSSAYFQKNFEVLSSRALVVAVDLRGHGHSGKPADGYHVARLAMDLQEIVKHIETIPVGKDPNTNINIVPIGCSIGAAILWTYVELFTDADFAGMVFVDQAPLQDRSKFDHWGQDKAHCGCYNEATMLAAQRTWIETPEEAFRGLVHDCLGYRFTPQDHDNVSDTQLQEDELFFTGESRKCNTVWLAKLLADHTRYDHREACERITVPVLVMAGRRTGCFPIEGMKETFHRVKKGYQDRGILNTQKLVQWTEFDSGHWLFWEEPERFNEEIMNFAKTCNAGQPSPSP